MTGIARAAQVSEQWLYDYGHLKVQHVMRLAQVYRQCALYAFSKSLRSYIAVEFCSPLQRTITSLVLPKFLVAKNLKANAT